MKYITLIIGLLVVGCGKQEQAKQEQADSGGTPAPPTPTTTEKPVIELTIEEKVVGEYEHKFEDGNTEKDVFLDNGILEVYINGKKALLKYKWSIVKGEIHVNVKTDSYVSVCRINKDKSITTIADIYGEKRTDYSKESQITYKKIK